MGIGAALLISSLVALIIAAKQATKALHILWVAAKVAAVVTVLLIAGVAYRMRVDQLEQARQDKARIAQMENGAALDRAAQAKCPASVPEADWYTTPGYWSDHTGASHKCPWAEAAAEALAARAAALAAEEEARAQQFDAWRAEVAAREAARQQAVIANHDTLRKQNTLVTELAECIPAFGTSDARLTCVKREYAKVRDAIASNAYLANSYLCSHHYGPTPACCPIDKPYIGKDGNCHVMSYWCENECSDMVKPGPLSPVTEYDYIVLTQEEYREQYASRVQGGKHVAQAPQTK